MLTRWQVTPITNEFHPSRPPLLSLAQNIGLLAGAIFWGFGCDIFGRRHAFNLTLGVTAVFGMIAACSPNFAAIGAFAALWSFGVGGNLPVDSAVFLEFLPGSHQYLLTVLSIDWALAQVVATLIAWPILGNLTCSEKEVCTRSKNMGWRYFVIAMGGISLVEFIVRFVFFTVYESPKYHMGKGNDEEAVRIVHEVARRNKKESNRIFNFDSCTRSLLMHRSTYRGPQSLRISRWWRAGPNRCRRSCEKKVGEDEPFACSSLVRDAKISILNITHHACLGVHWARVSPLQRVHSLHSGDQWRKIWRWFDVFDIQEFAHHCLARSARSNSWRSAGGGAEVWSPRNTGCVDGADRSLSVCVNHGSLLGCTTRLAMRIQLLLKHHVCVAILYSLHSRDAPHGH